MPEVFLTPEQQIRQRHAWFEEAKRLGNVTVACRRLGISRKTFYKWRQRFAASRGARQALLDRSCRPNSPHRADEAHSPRPRRLRCLLRHPTPPPSVLDLYAPCYWNGGRL